jgi:hypothetical protein
MGLFLFGTNEYYAGTSFSRPGKNNSVKEFGLRI